MVGVPEMYSVDGSVGGDGLFDRLVDRLKAFGDGHPQDDDVSMLEVEAAPFGLNVVSNNDSSTSNAQPRH
ncbi:MAG: hypothetical protein ACI9B8_000170 [Sulfitobacter sp.]|jgi:hypothetical protein